MWSFNDILRETKASIKEYEDNLNKGTRLCEWIRKKNHNSACEWIKIYFFNHAQFIKSHYMACELCILHIKFFTNNKFYISRIKQLLNNNVRQSCKQK